MNRCIRLILMAQPERAIIRDRIDLICAQYTPWTLLDPIWRATLVRRLERGCFEVVIAESISDGINRLFTERKFVDRYSAICGRVMANLDVTGSVGSSHTIDLLLANSIDPHDVATMSSFTLCPQSSNTIRREISIRQNQKVIEKVSRAHHCYKCGGNETIPLEYQSRAADESSSYSIKCVICGYVWRK